MLKRFFVLFLLAGAAIASVAACSEYDDSALWDEINSLKERVDKLEKDAADLNSDVNALRTTLQAIRDEDVVTGIRSIVVDGKAGWEITFRKSGTVNIFVDRDSFAPRVGVTLVDGVLCWTVDGEVLKDASGKPVSAVGPKGETGATPQFKVEDDYWYVKYSESEGWVKLGKAVDSTLASMFRSVALKDGNLVITLGDGRVLTIPVLSVAETNEFDENAVVLSLGAISDTHIGNQYGSEDKFTNALKMLKTQAALHDADGLDAVIVAGDLVNTVNTGQIYTFKTRYEQVFDPVKVPMIYTIGNHDMNSDYVWSTNTVSSNAVFHSILGDNYFLTDQDQTMRTNFECRHCIVGDYHILCITPNGSNPVIYDANATIWLNNTLKTITEADPQRYVLLITHPMIYNTVYGSDLGTYWYTSALTDILSAYPQVVTFSGHLHFPINDPRSIWQGDFTSVGCGSTSYMAFEGGDYENKSGNTVLNDAGDVSSGHLVQFDANGNMRITRLDFTRQAVIGTAWETSFPTNTKKHLEKYDHAALRAANTAPSLSTVDVTVGTITSGKADVTVRFAAGTDDEFVHHYGISVRNGFATVATKNYMSDFYRCPQPSQMKNEWECTFASLAEGSYTVSVIAYDSWGAASAPLTKDFEIGASSGHVSKWTADTAGSAAHEGGSGSVSSGWLSYADGTVSWTANDTGRPRSASLELPDGSTYELSQLEVKDFAGTWSFTGKTFAPNTNLGISASNSFTKDLTFTVKSGQTAQYSGVSVTNNLAVSGLINTYVAEAAVIIEYDSRTLRLGFFFDGENAQAVNTGKSGYGYMTLLPELGNAWTSYNFCPVPFNGGTNKGWLWFVPNSLTSMHYGREDWQKCDGKDILGLAFCACKSANPSASDYATVNTNSGYDVIWQCNTDTKDDPGFILTKK